MGPLKYVRIYIQIVIPRRKLLGFSLHISKYLYETDSMVLVYILLKWI